MSLFLAQTHSLLEPFPNASIYAAINPSISQYQLNVYSHDDSDELFAMSWPCGTENVHPPGQAKTSEQRMNRRPFTTRGQSLLARVTTTGSWAEVACRRGGAEQLL
jgi:hypothetical protein